MSAVEDRYSPHEVAMLVAQNRRCALCPKEISITQCTLAFDDEGELRGLLCDLCSLYVELIKRDSVFKERICDYLSNRGAVHIQTGGTT